MTTKCSEADFFARWHKIHLCVSGQTFRRRRMLLLACLAAFSMITTGDGMTRILCRTPCEAVSYGSKYYHRQTMDLGYTSTTDLFGEYTYILYNLGQLCLNHLSSLLKHILCTQICIKNKLFKNKTPDCKSKMLTKKMNDMQLKASSM